MFILLFVSLFSFFNMYILNYKLGEGSKIQFDFAEKWEVLLVLINFNLFKGCFV